MRRLAILLALLVPALARARRRRPRRREAAYLPAAQATYANTPDGAQARYDAGRDLVEAVVAVGPVGTAERALRADLLARGRAQVARAEALDRDDGFRSLGPLAPLPAGEPASARGVRTRRWRAASLPRPRRRTAPSGSGCTT